MTKHILGFDVGGTKCSAILGSYDCQISDKITFATPADFCNTWKLFLKKLDILLKRNSLSISDCSAVGISCGSPLDSVMGIVKSPPNLPGWDNIHIVELGRKTFSLPVFLMNDANACALAEYQLGAGVGNQHMVFFTMGTGLGAGIIINGQVYEGKSGMAGEFGHCRLRENGPTGYNKAGSFEGFCGGAGIAKNAEKIAAQYQPEEAIAQYLALIGNKDYSVKNLAFAATKDNQFAKYVFAETGKMLGYGLSWIIDGLNPELIVIGSIFQRCEALIKPAMTEILTRECLPENLAAVQIVPAVLGDNIGDYAALIIAKNGLERLKAKKTL